MTTKIEWTDATWNPVTGCTKVSPGCAHCYAETIAKRFNRNGGSYLPGQAEIICHPDRLAIPLSRKKPTMYFVNSMSDLFHEDVPDEFIDAIWIVMWLAPQHTFQILTKRPERMLHWSKGPINVERFAKAGALVDRICPGVKIPKGPAIAIQSGQWLLDNVWLGVSVENQYWADQRIPLLLQTPAAVRFLSIEPLLKPVNLMPYMSRFVGLSDEGEVYAPLTVPNLHWVIIGGESGPEARPMNEAWAQSIINDCRAANVPVFMKQIGSVWAKAHRLKGKAGDIKTFPNDLQVREWPKTLAPTTSAGVT